MSWKNLKVGQTVVAELPTEVKQAHEKGNLDLLKNAFNKFIDEELKEKDEHDSRNLQALRDNFVKFLTEEAGE